MERKFKCLQCGHQFETYLNMMVTCPQCNSDNVTPIKSGGLKKYITMSGVFVLMCGVGFVLSEFIQKPTEELDDNENIVYYDENNSQHESISQSESQLDKEETPKVEDIVLDINMDSKTLISDKKTKTYSFVAVCKNPIEGKTIMWELKESFGDKIVGTSEDGKFENIPPAKNESGSYTLIATCEGAKGRTEIFGFENIDDENKIPTLKASELERRINNLDREISSDYRIAQKCELVFKGIRDDVNIPDNIQKICFKIMNETWKMVKVNSVEYDDENYIKKITLTPIYPEI